jgi:NADPH-dependent 2,4-dienoyl-CoA reductase/sulfur reductase-like enzyme
VAFIPSVPVAKLTCAKAHAGMAAALARVSTAPSRRVVIVGGVAGGASAATRLRRLDEDASITIFERGPDVSFANCGLPYHIGGEIVDRSRLFVTTPAALATRFRIDVHTRTEVVSIDREHKMVRVRALNDGNSERDVPYDTLILSPGARAVLPPPFNTAPPHPRICTLRNPSDMDTILRALPLPPAAGEDGGGAGGQAGPDAARRCRPRRAVVIGGGYIGLELAEALVHRGGGGTHGNVCARVCVCARAHTRRRPTSRVATRHRSALT